MPKLHYRLESAEENAELNQRRWIKWKWGVFSREEIEETDPSLLKLLDIPPTVVHVQKRGQLENIEKLIAGGVATNIKRSSFGFPILSLSEHSIEECLVQCWESIEVFRDYKFDSRQVVVKPKNGKRGGDRADIVLLSQKKNKLMVVEIKKNVVDKDALNQLRRYMNVLAKDESGEYSGMKVCGCLIGGKVAKEVKKGINPSEEIFLMKYSVEGYSRNSKGYENGMIVSVGFKKS